jgi:hypothetical protein
MPYGSINMQASLSAITASCVPAELRPQGLAHHPITCDDVLAFDDDGLSCPHASVPPDDARVQAALNGSIAYLLFELLVGRELRHSS